MLKASLKCLKQIDAFLDHPRFVFVAGICMRVALLLDVIFRRVTWVTVGIAVIVLVSWITQERRCS
jgi:hypothetical protein